jgi:hypothetical protein
MPPLIKSYEVSGASDGIRTRDQELGKLLLYQLSYARLRYLTRSLPNRYVDWKPRIDAERVYHEGEAVHERERSSSTGE